MCPSETKLISSSSKPHISHSVHGRPVLQPTCNRVPLDRRNSLKKIAPKTPPPPRTSVAKTSPSPTSPRLRSPRPPAIKRGNDNHVLNSSSDKITLPRSTLTRSVSTLDRKKSKKWGVNNNASDHTPFDSNMMTGYSSSLIMDAPGSIAAVRREHMALQHAQHFVWRRYGEGKEGKGREEEGKEMEKHFPSLDKWEDEGREVEGVGNSENGNTLTQPNSLKFDFENKN